MVNDLCVYLHFTNNWEVESLFVENAETVVVVYLFQNQLYDAKFSHIDEKISVQKV